MSLEAQTTNFLQVTNDGKIINDLVVRTADDNFQLTFLAGTNVSAIPSLVELTLLEHERFKIVLENHREARDRLRK